MKSIFFSCLIGMTLFFSTIIAECHKPKQGPPGPQGPTGATGAVVSYYASSAGLTAQGLTAASQTPISFPTNLVVPVGILHPYLTDTTNFLVQFAGIYQISWIVNVEWDNTGGNTIQLYLYNAATATFYSPAPISSATYDINAGATGARLISLSGTTTQQLNAGDVVELQLANLLAPVIIDSATMSFTYIAN